MLERKKIRSSSTLVCIFFLEEMILVINCVSRLIVRELEGRGHARKRKRPTATGAAATTPSSNSSSRMSEPTLGEGQADYYRVIPVSWAEMRVDPEGHER